jgi:hypothetical protein
MYRLQTERKNVRRVKNLLSDLGLDFTILFGEGSYELTDEKSMTIELDRTSKKQARTAAVAIKSMNRQKYVLLQEIKTESELI